MPALHTGPNGVSAILPAWLKVQELGQELYPLLQSRDTLDKAQRAFTEWLKALGASNGINATNLAESREAFLNILLARESTHPPDNFIGFYINTIKASGDEGKALALASMQALSDVAYSHKDPEAFRHRQVSRKLDAEILRAFPQADAVNLSKGRLFSHAEKPWKDKDLAFFLEIIRPVIEHKKKGVLISQDVILSPNAIVFAVPGKKTTGKAKAPKDIEFRFAGSNTEINCRNIDNVMRANDKGGQLSSVFLTEIFGPKADLIAGKPEASTVLNAIREAVKNHEIHATLPTFKVHLDTQIAHCQPGGGRA